MRLDGKMLGLAEAGSGAVLFFTGLLLMNTKILPTWHSLDLLLRILSAPAWGTLFVVLGLGQLMFFRLIDGGLERPWLRCMAALFIAVLWGMMSYSAFFPLSDTPPPPWAVQMLGWWFINACLAVRVVNRRRNGF